MPIFMPNETSRELIPAGSHTAVCYRVIDCGTQPTSYGPKRQILFGFELPDELMSGGQPFVISRRFTYSADRKSALRCEIESWLGRPLTAADFGKFDLSEMLGRTCMIGIKHDVREGRTYANVTSIMRPPKGVPERLSVINPATALSLDDRPFPAFEFESLPDWLREMIKKSPEYAAAGEQKPAGGMRRQLAAPTDDLDDQIPL